MPRASAVTWDMPSTRRRRLPDFLRRKCWPVPLRCSTLPFRVTRNRFAAPRCVFCFMVDPSSHQLLAVEGGAGTVYEVNRAAGPVYEAEGVADACSASGSSSAAAPSAESAPEPAPVEELPDAASG